MKATMAGAALLCLGAAGCSLAPPYQAPDTPQIERFKEAPPAAEVDGWSPARPADDTQRGAWWTSFGDPRLADLETRAQAANQNLKAAESRYRQSRAVADQAAAALFPFVNLTTAAKRLRVSENIPRIHPNGPSVGSDFNLRAELGYELDFWGRVHDSVASARSSAQASAGDLETARLSLQAELATDWFLLRGLDAQAELLQSSVAAYQEAQRITQNRYQGGAAAIADVYQSATQLENARVQLANTQQQRAQLEHAIAILIGEPPSLLALPAVPLDLEPPAVSPGLPSRLLERRPDVAAAERRVAAANAQVGVARAAWFPAFTLGISAGFESTASDNWLTASSRAWAIGPQAILTLFDAGRRQAQEDQAVAAYDEMAANYRETVLSAVGEVEDQLAAIHWLDEQRGAQQRAVQSSTLSLEQANYRYLGGIANYLEVTSAQTAALQARQADLNLRVQRLAATVGLIKALGGDWGGLPSAGGDPKVGGMASVKNELSGGTPQP